MCSSFMLLGRASWPVKEKNIIRIGRNNATMVYPERMFTDRRLQWFGHLKRMEENA